MTGHAQWVAGWMAAAAALTGGCGGQDPLTMFPDEGGFGELQLPLTADTNFISTISAFSAASPYWDMTVVSSQLQTIVAQAPGDGVVTDVVSTSEGITVTIAHNSRFASRLSRLATVSVREGDKVLKGATVGTGASTVFGQIRFEVFLDGGARCPLSFLNEAGRQKIAVTWVGGFNFNPCQ